MKKILPDMYDHPEPMMIIGSLGFGFWCFFIFPTLMALFCTGVTSPSTLSWFEFGYHITNFIGAIWLFFPYLKESFFNAQINLKQFFSVSFVCAAVCFVYAATISRFGLVSSDYIYQLVAQSTLPLMESGFFNTYANFICINPIFGTICVTLLSPLTVSCLFYATGFAPVCCSKPWLAYITVAVVTAAPGFWSIMSLWTIENELSMYLVQLPIHLIACVAYQKTDTVWAPVAVLTITNILGCLAIFLHLGIG